MKPHLFICLIFCGSTVAICQSAYSWQDKPKSQVVKSVKRAARPSFDRSESKDIFFKDVYAQGTVGQRPNLAALSPKATTLASSGNSAADSESVWSQIIDASVIEDEVKSLQMELNTLVTTPVIFQTKYNDINERFEVLSMLFAIIRQYDGDIRWTEHAATAQFLFQKAAVSSRAGTAKGFQYCKARKEDLQELVRGGSIADRNQIPDSIDWSVAVNRSPIMERLEVANEDLKRMTSSASEFQSNIEDVFRLSNLMAAMAKVIVQDGMPEAEEESYAEFGKKMQAASLELKSAVKLNDFQAASKAANAVSQSCDNCHAQWR